MGLLRATDGGPAVRSGRVAGLRPPTPTSVARPNCSIWSGTLHIGKREKEELKSVTFFKTSGSRKGLDSSELLLPSPVGYVHNF